MGKFLRVVVAQAEVFFFQPQRQQPFPAEPFPVGEPFQLRTGFAEEFHLHLFELAGAENEVPRRDFVAETFTDLADAEVDFAPRGALDVVATTINDEMKIAAALELA